MNNRDLVETVNRGHAALLSQLRSLKSTDRSFSYWLTSAALRFCLAFKNVKLEGKLIHVDDLEKAVKEGFQQMKHRLSDLPKEERDHAKYCLARFTKVSDEKANKSRAEKVGTPTCYGLRSKGSIAKTFEDSLSLTYDKQIDSEMENKVKAATNLKNGKTPSDLEGRQSVSRASIQLTVMRREAQLTGQLLRRARKSSKKVNVLPASTSLRYRGKAAARGSYGKRCRNP